MNGITLSEQNEAIRLRFKQKKDLSEVKRMQKIKDEIGRFRDKIRKSTIYNYLLKKLEGTHKIEYKNESNKEPKKIQVIKRIKSEKIQVIKRINSIDNYKKKTYYDKTVKPARDRKLNLDPQMCCYKLQELQDHYCYNSINESSSPSTQFTVAESEHLSCEPSVGNHYSIPRDETFCLNFQPFQIISFQPNNNDVLPDNQTNYLDTTTMMEEIKDNEIPRLDEKHDTSSGNTRPLPFCDPKKTYSQTPQIIHPENFNCTTQDQPDILPPRFPVSSNYSPMAMPNYIYPRFPYYTPAMNPPYVNPLNPMYRDGNY
ncbi:hypothetical protein QTN25_010023 [Entamoeba marina]